MRRAGSGSGALSGTRSHCRRSNLPFLPRDRGRHRGPGLRVQATDRVFRGSARRGSARTSDRAHSSRASPGAGDPRCEARRHRRHCRALRPRGLRALRRRRGDALALHGLRFDRAVSGLCRPRSFLALPDQQPGRRRSADARCRRNRALPAGRTARGDRLEYQRSARTRGRRDLPARTGGGARAGRNHAAAGSGHRRTGRRHRSQRDRRADGRRNRHGDQFVARDPVCR